MLTLLILALVSVATGVVVINKLSDKKDEVVETPPFDGEPIVLDPPALPTFPDIVYWDYMTSCDEIETRIQEIETLLMTSKFSQELYEFWTQQLERGRLVYAERCKKSNL